MIRVKICGITRPQDALAAAQAGADAIGMVFYAGSPRAIDAERAVEIVAVLPPFVTAVALFVNATTADVAKLLDLQQIDLLQFHGDEDEVYCSQFGMPYIKAIRVGADTDLVQCARNFHSAKGLLLDAQVAGSYGGTGHTFDWQRIPRDLTKPIILSGGLTPQNVGLAVSSVKPWAVDVSTGVEAAKGIKDAHKIADFINKARNADV
jgi:phosphoribosylanthranilate isomerase